MSPAPTPTRRTHTIVSRLTFHGRYASETQDAMKIRKIGEMREAADLIDRLEDELVVQKQQAGRLAGALEAFCGCFEDTINGVRRDDGQQVWQTARKELAAWKEGRA